jgi:glutamine amidotransferase
MCRHLAYLGPPVSLAELLFDRPHALLHQSWAPRDMRGGGTINADGFGVGWYPADTAGDPPPVRGGSDSRAGGEPVRYRCAGPIWSDQALPGLAATIAAGAVLAAVRSATTGMPVVATAAAPFADGRWLFSHNGVIVGWPDSVGKLAERLPVRDLLTLDAPTDSALLWALVRHRLRAGAPVDAALAQTVREVLRAAPGSRLNLLLTDGHTAAATTVGHSLSLRQATGEVLIASEPLDDDPSWRPVPDHRLITATTSRVDVTELGGT